MVGDVSPLKVKHLSLNSIKQMWNSKVSCISLSIYVHRPFSLLETETMFEEQSTFFYFYFFFTQNLVPVQN